MEIARFVTLNAVRQQRAGLRRNRGGKIRESVRVYTRVQREENRRSTVISRKPERCWRVGRKDDNRESLWVYLERGKGGGGGSDYSTVHAR